jgi:hypothetical protein
MKRILLMFLAVAMTGMIGSGGAWAGQYGTNHAAGTHKEYKAEGVTKLADLKTELRGLWLGHIFWVRNVALTTKYGDAEAAKVAEERTVENAKALAGSIAPFYGQAASDSLFSLLAGHYGAIKGYMTAAYASDKAAKDAARDKLVKNADEIALFLNKANPNLPKETLTGLLRAHGAHHLGDIDALAGKDYVTEAKVWDEMKKHVCVIADALATGLAKQFPKKVH